MTPQRTLGATDKRAARRHLLQGLPRRAGTKFQQNPPVGLAPKTDRPLVDRNRAPRIGPDQNRVQAQTRQHRIGKRAILGHRNQPNDRELGRGLGQRRVALVKRRRLVPAPCPALGGAALHTKASLAEKHVQCRLAVRSAGAGDRALVMRNVPGAIQPRLRKRLSHLPMVPEICAITAGIPADGVKPTASADRDWPAPSFAAG